ncbi:MAG: glycosyltransferase family 9 protein [Nitrospinae bacterium]|nr:glycosyltransferase family 9 protein [Nitrospinota bacterium]
MATRILIYRMGAFGDTLLLALLFKQLHTHYENPHITLAANPNYAAPLLDSGLIHETLDGGSRPFHLLYNEQPQENDALYRLIAHYDKSMFYTSDISGELFKRLNSKGLDNCHIHPPFPPASDEIHICEWMMRPWPFLSVPVSEKFRLKPSKRNLILADEILNQYRINGNFFFIHPGGGGKNKWIPSQILTTIVRRHSDETGQRPVVIEGPADSVASEEFQRFWGDSIPIFRDIQPKVLSALLSKSSAYFGGDSGVSHLASLYATHATVLYGSDSNMRVWRPAGSGTQCIPWETNKGLR